MKFYNCHTHLFTIKNVPDNFLQWYLKVLKYLLVRDWFIGFLKGLGLGSVSYIIQKFKNFELTNEYESQEKVFDHLKGFYPQDTGFVVLSMDMEFMGCGKVAQSFEGQLEELAVLKKKFPENIFPFVFAHPERENVLELVKHSIEKNSFTGIKLYPPVGYFPGDRRLDVVYAYAEEYQIPIISHCARGGVFYRGELDEFRRTIPETGEVLPKQRKFKFTDQYSDPARYEDVLKRFPNLKLCFAHYGGEIEWDKYLKESDHEALKENWMYKIHQFIDQYPNVYTDFSYTLTRQDLYPFLKVSLQDSSKKIKDRVLFGTDYYMTEQEGSERSHGINLRAYLGEELWEKIAVENPKRFLQI